MSATLVSSNTTIKVNAAVGATFATNGTVYTAPADGYAIVNLVLSGGFNATVQVGGRNILSTASTQNTVYIGPSQSLVVSFYSAGTLWISGVSFINTP
jgi:hypothetical protein